MIVVELYSKEECHLCEIAKATLEKARKRYPFELREVKIREGEERYEEFKDRIPVVFINSEFAFQHRVPEETLVARLKAAS
jgi:glutaredoxin